ncbi:MAG: TerB family tellurite resistance protein [Deltaproteobacteria bacterium]|nr:TerB family tellurite resistance protein [Deltaproteobacteria bacterium]
MDPLAWLGLKSKSEAHPNVSAVFETVTAALPQHEAPVIRYVVVVAILLTRVAFADGRFAPREHLHLRRQLRRIGALPDEAVEDLCDVLCARVPELSAAELELLFRELKSLCDAKERLQVLRLLAAQAASDGELAPAEHGELVAVATELGVPVEVLSELEVEALVRVETGAEGSSRPPASSSK